MSNEFEHKIYNYEVTPPAGLWDKINAELDSSELNAGFPQKLKSFSTALPPEAWSKIASVLYGSSFIHDYATRLEDLEVAPPLSAWDKIQDALNAEEQKPAHKKVIPLFRYAAAAAILALIAFAGSRFLNKESKGDQVAIQKPVLSNLIPIVPVPTATNNISQEPVIISQDQRNEDALEASKKTFAKLDASPSTKIKHAAEFFFAAEPDETVTRGLPDYTAPEQIHDENINNRYVVLMTPEGNIIRMSKKLADLVCCVSGEDQEKECMDQMNKWREKIACAPAGHSTGNFLDLLNLVCSLDEN